MDYLLCLWGGLLCLDASIQPGPETENTKQARPYRAFLSFSLCRAGAQGQGKAYLTKALGQTLFVSQCLARIGHGCSDRLVTDGEL